MWLLGSIFIITSLLVLYLKYRVVFTGEKCKGKIIDIVEQNAGYMLRIDCWEAEKNLKTTPGSDCALNTLAIDEPLEYARLYLDGNMQMWVDAEDSLEL